MVAPGLRRAVEKAIGADAATWRRVGESAWASTWQLSAKDGRHFVKLARDRDVLACEADGLRALAATRTVRVPRVIAEGEQDDGAWLVLAWLDLRPTSIPASLGTELAAMHFSAAPAGPHGERFGWHRDNRLGATRQRNAWTDDWSVFFRDRRLVPQIALAARNGHHALTRVAETLAACVPALLDGHAPKPALLHGDLWSGNAGALASGEAVLFDPAVYVGDRETDLAMTELFGGFDRAFHDAYANAWPLDGGYPLRRDLYNVYHLLNHVNLFGGGYVARTQRAIAALLATTGH